MKWIVCFCVSVFFFLASIIWSIVKTKRRNTKLQLLKPINVLIIGVFLSGIFLFYPVYFDYFAQTSYSSARVFKSILLSCHNAIRLFVIDSDFEMIATFTALQGKFIETAYPILASLIFVVAPLLTFGFILSFFKNLISYLRYVFSFNKKVYVFSEINESALSLATDISRRHKKSLIVFTDVYKSEDERSYEMLERVYALNAICFKKDITLINFNFHSKKSKLLFFILNESEDENVNMFTKLVDTYKDRDLTELYLFSKSNQSDLILSNLPDNKIKIRRVNHAQAVIYRNLYDNSDQLFRNAKVDKDGNKVISAVIIGLGNYGSTLTKTLAWYCQMDGYKIKINAFDQNNDAKSIFSSSCPELISKQYNGVSVPGEAEYLIDIHSGYDYHTDKFDKKIKEIDDATFVFVSIGSDEANIDCATKLRMIFERMNIHPEINAVIYNSEHKDLLLSAKNFRGQSYDINFIGDVNSTYCESVIIDSELEQDALERHKKYGKEKDFWKHQYNYRSSMASAIHMKARIACNIPGADKKENDLTEEEANIIEVLEHKRWNAYMRSEGYIFGEKRNDLGKMHDNLIKFDDLTEELKRLDRKVGSK